MRKAYRTGGRSVEALKGVDLSIPGPGFYAIMGRSGSGKSTLLHLLAALDTPDEGTIELAGRSVQSLSDREATDFRRNRLGIVFQQFNLVSTLTALENVELPGLLARMNEGELRARSLELLDRLGLGERASHRPQALSGGEQQRVAIARALLFDPPIILADEPTGNLDSSSADRLWRLLGDVARDHNTTVVMVTHEATAAASCSRVFIMHDGRIVGEFATEGLDATGVAARAHQLTPA